MKDENTRMAAMQAEFQETIAKLHEDFTARLRVLQASNKSMWYSWYEVEAAPLTRDTVFPYASVERAAGQLTLEESFAGTASSDVVAEVAPLTGDTAAPDASVERAARQLALEESSANRRLCELRIDYLIECGNIFSRKYFMAVRKFTNIFVLRLILMVGSRDTLFLVCFT